MRSIGKVRVRKRRLAVALAVGALAVAAPVSGASAATTPFNFLGRSFTTPIVFPYTAAGFAGNTGLSGGTVFNQGPQTGVTTTGCGEYRPSLLGGTGGAQQTNCYTVLAFNGPSIGQINSQIGPTIIGGTVLGPVIVSAGNVVNAIP
jgi:hypothetical protein